MAPEQISYETTTGAADWYAVGVMLYQSLAGRLPFSGSFSKLLSAKQRNNPPAFQQNVPEELASLCHQLMCPVPDRRPTGDEILSVLVPEETDPQFFQPVKLSEKLFGRDSQLELLNETANTFASQTGPQTIFISGRSGEGKTVLAEQFLSRFQKNPNYTILAGRCYDRESVPFKALDTLIDALCNHLQSLPTSEIRGLLTPEASVLGELFPTMNRIPEIAAFPDLGIEDLEPERVRSLVSDVLADLFRKLSKTTTIVCFIDDLHADRTIVATGWR